MDKETPSVPQMSDEWWQELNKWVTGHPIFNDDRLRASVDNFDQALFLLQITNFQYERLSEKYREMADALPDAEKRAYFLEQLAILKYGQDIARGQKIRLAASKGHTAVHGTTAEKSERWATYQTVVDGIRLAHPRWSWESVKQHASKRLGVSESTIKRHCVDPKKLGQSGQ